VLSTVPGFPADPGTPEWKAFTGGREAALPVPAAGKTGFTLLPPAATGVLFTNTLSDRRAAANINLLNGSGLALGDYDGDGLCDIYLCNLNGTNALFRNLGGWRWKEIAAEAGVECLNQTSTGAVFADLNGDGRPDLMVTSMGGPNACFLNLGGGRFTNVTAAAGLTSRLGSTSSALADIDGNGTLDLYVANYGVNSLLRSGGVFSFSYVNGQPVVRGRHAQRIKIIDGVMYELGEPDALYLNDGNSRFTPVSWTEGAFLDERGDRLPQIPWDQGLAVMFRDLNRDGRPDIYVCNDVFTPDRCWINDGHGRFRALPSLALRSTSYFSMSVDVADIDRDGFDDLFVVDMLSRQHRLVLTQKSSMYRQPRLPGEILTQPQLRRNTLFLNRGDGTYAEIANQGGVAASEWSWSGIFLDVDLDGWEDILISNGFPHDLDDADVRQRVKSMPAEQSNPLLALYPRLATPNVVFRNLRDLTFQETGREWGFDSTEVSNGTALGDLDNDGDLDVVVNCLNSPALVYRNDTVAPRLAVRLRGKSPNTHGIGSRIKVIGGPVTQTQEMMSGGRYVSGDDAMRVFAAGDSTNLTIEVGWRSGARSVVRGCRPNHVYEIDEARAADSTLVPPAKPAEPPAYFEDVSRLLRHQHHEEPFDDFARQPLLPNRLSQLGPGVAWFDVDQDGRDDLIIGTGKGGRLAVYRNDVVRGFLPLEAPALQAPASRDQTALVGWTSSKDSTSVFVGSASYEEGGTHGDSVLRYDFRRGQVTGVPGLPSAVASVGPLAMTDIDGTGRLVLFVGSRVVPGRYPEAGASRIFAYDGKQWTLDATNSASLAMAGLVSAAVWSDLDGDGFPELILACEWGPVRVFKNHSGILREATLDLGLAEYTGWWTGVTTGDLDGDGRLDIVAGNWGLNSSYLASREHPARLFHGDWNNAATVEVLEAKDDPQLGIVPRRDLGEVAAALPFLNAAFSTFRAFAGTNVAGVLGDRMARSHELRATTLASTVFLNRGGRFEAVALPREAQFAPAFAVCVADMDGDGHEDVFLSQNFFATQPETPRLDAGRGLWLRNSGSGKLEPVPGQVSGVKVYGEQRGAAVADYDGDGRVDLGVTQNGTETRLYRNVRARPGLRVQVKGPDGNPDGIGAVLRLSCGERQGPAREIHAGSGYWSQDSRVQVMGTPASPTQIQVRWPGGGTSSWSVPADAKKIEVSAAGVKAIP